MTRRTRTIVFVLAAVVLGSVTRLAFVAAEGFGPADLSRYEQRSYGADLPDEYGDRPFWLAWSRGDGQAYVTLAADPLAQDETRELGAALYRFARVGYSWAALVMVGGQFDLIPYGLFAVNLIALGIIGFLAARLYEEWGPRSIALLVTPGVLLSVMTDTAEAFGFALMAVSVIAAPVGSIAAAAVLGAVRPDFATALLLRGRQAPATLIAAAASAIGIRLLGIWLGLEFAGLNGNLTYPFGGYIDVLGTQTWSDAAITIGLLLAAVASVWRGLRLERGWARWAFIGTGTFVLMLSPAVLFEAGNSLRAAAALWFIWAGTPGWTPKVHDRQPVA